MEYEEFAAYVWELITRRNAYEVYDEDEGDPDTETIRVRVCDEWGERTAGLRLGALYEAIGQLDKQRIRNRVNQLIPWSSKTAEPLTSDDCRRILGAQRQPMFESLRLLRQAYARRENVAPYIIFSNHTLLAMCQEGPETLEELRQLPGVGAVNSSRYGQGFLELIRYHNQKGTEIKVCTESLA